MRKKMLTGYRLQTTVKAEDGRRKTEDNWSIHQQSWPKFDNKYLQEEEATIVIQINGRVRETRVISKEIESNRAVVEKMVLQSDRIKNLLAGQSVKKTVYIPGKIINFVV